jgi:hypothetical protein
LESPTATGVPLRTWKVDQRVWAPWRNNRMYEAVVRALHPADGIARIRYTDDGQQDDVPIRDLEPSEEPQLEWRARVLDTAFGNLYVRPPRRSFFVLISACGLQ